MVGGKCVYSAGFADEEEAARDRDAAAMRLQGPTARINFPLELAMRQAVEKKKKPVKAALKEIPDLPPGHTVILDDIVAPVQKLEPILDPIEPAKECFTIDVAWLAVYSPIERMRQDLLIDKLIRAGLARAKAEGYTAAQVQIWTEAESTPVSGERFTL